MASDQFSLRFEIADIQGHAARYAIDDRERRVVEEISPAVRERGFFTKPEFLEVCYWKSPRSKTRYETNDPEFVREVTTVALSTPSERLRIEALTLLTGVAWPTASVLLHLGHEEPYPILDYRALWTFGIDAGKIIYNFAFWSDYVQVCRRHAADGSVSMRVLDRALWQFSKDRQSAENQPA